MNVPISNALPTSDIGQNQAPNWWQQVKNSTFYIKLTNWEYWSMYVSNIPLVLIWLWFALRSRRLFFFTAVNPVIETGGAWGESKYHILQRIPAKHLPKTAFIPKGADFEEIKVKFQQADLSYPVIAKPNIGERGLLVKKIKDEHELAEYAAKNNMDFLIQEFVSLPLELAVMPHRFPGETKGKVTSICIKETLKITGDGR
ncbi:MAG: hypothetical protein AAB316_11155, partial [Bacteroidota bacterium]